MFVTVHFVLDNVQFRYWQHVCALFVSDLRLQSLIHFCAQNVQHFVIIFFFRTQPTQMEPCLHSSTPACTREYHSTGYLLHSEVSDVGHDDM